MIDLTNLKNDIESLIDESCGKSLKETEGLKHISIDEGKDIVTVIVGLGVLSEPFETNIKRAIAKLVKLDYNHKGLKITIEESRVFNSIVTKKDITFIGIISGKGGVGKSSVAANIAYRMAKKGIHVGLIDADIYGSSLPTILGIEHRKPDYDSNKKIIPLKKDGIELISTEFFTDPSQPVIWRGSMLNSMISHFFYDTKWSDETSYVIVDFPPGTGDIMLDIKNIIPSMKMLLVTTPHPSASHVAVKAGSACKTLGHEILGVVENMSYYTNPVTTDKEYIFGEGGGLKVSQDLGTEFICQLEISVPKDGTDIFDISEPNGKVYDELAEYIIYKTTK